MKKRNSFYLFMFLILFSFSILPMNQVNAESEMGTGYDYDDDIAIPSIHEDTEDGISALSDELDTDSDIPESYSSVDLGYVTPVKNQNSTSWCWIFGNLAAGETEYIKNSNLNNSDVDFSELLLGYSFFHDTTDPLGLIDGDYNFPSESSYLSNGGSSLRAVLELSTWAGAVDESNASWSSRSTLEDTLSSYSDSELTNLLYQKDVAHLQNARYVSKTDVTEVKEMIMEYGAASVSYKNLAKYFSTGRLAYYNDTTTGTGHCVCVVGWDDNYSADNFTGSATPSSDGAWLVKNSWGTSTHNAGYFWMSYETESLGDFFFLDFEDSDDYDNNYQYDGNAASYYYSSTVPVYTANVFTSQKDEETLKAVSLYNIYTTNLDYTISVYTNLTDESDPTSGTLSDTVTGTCTYCGYYTIPLNLDIDLTRGTTFAIVEKLEKGNSKVNYAYSSTIGTFVNSSEAGQSFVSKDGATWTDSSADGTNYRIKAFTDTVSDSVTVHYYSSWGGANIYYWDVDGSSNNPVTWPGVSMNSEGDNWYSFTLEDASSMNLIFNYGSNQTDDLYRASGEWWYYNGTWYDEKPVSTTTNEEDITLHYYSTADTAYLYYWNTNGEENNPVVWPGVTMTSESDNWYTYTLEDITSANVIFSDSNGQTSDLSRTAGEWWYYNSTWYSANPLN